jgi:peptidase E
MPSGKGKMVLMGSGEMTATMVEVHKNLIKQLTKPQQAAFLDTPAGFQLNVDQISQKAVEYFHSHVRQPLAISSFKSNELTTDFDAEKAFHILRESGYILIGPGSPTYAVAQWKASPVPEILAQCIHNGGCVVAASAAALTVGRFTLPVYEIYKVGQPLHWVDGMDILGNFDLNLVVVPHWNNAEGGNHDTRFCFMGEPRFRKLIALMKENVPVLGLDEHTACILDLATEEAVVKGIGSVTLRHDDREIIFTSGDRFPLSVLRGQTGDSKWKSRAVKGAAAENGGDIDSDTFWDQIHSLEESFQNGLASRDARMATNALLELDRSIWQAQTDLENDELITEARDTLRNLMVLLGTELAATPKNKAECLSPLVKGLLELRHNFRSKKQWSEADAIRDVLSQVNITVEDNKNGSHWHLEAE